MQFVVLETSYVHVGIYELYRINLDRYLTFRRCCLLCVHRVSRPRLGVPSGDLSDGLQVTNTLLAGGAFTVHISGSDVTITDGSGNMVNVIITDVPGSNGIIHVTDSVSLPG